MPKHESQQSPLGDLEGWRQLTSLVQDKLQERTQQGRLRELRCQASHPNLGWLDLTHNDYLGLGQSQDFQDDVRAACRHIPVGASASRLLGGEHLVYQELEAAWSQFKQVDSSLYVNSGYAANEIVGSLLAFADCCMFSDELNHASIIDGIRLGGLPKSQRRIFKHNDLNDLEKHLQQSTAKLNLIWTESLFSMDGDIAPLAEIQDLAKAYRGLLIVDEAHALGCYGPQGEGLIAELGLDARQMITVNPCGKAISASGALITGPTWFREFMINFARPFIFSTGPSLWLAKAVLLATRRLAAMKDERQHLQALSLRLRHGLQEMGLNTGTSCSQIIPIIVGSEQRALGLEKLLLRHHILAKAVRPPSVLENSCRIRLSLHSKLTNQNIDDMLRVFKKWQTTAI